MEVSSSTQCGTLLDLDKNVPPRRLEFMFPTDLNSHGAQELHGRNAG